MLTEQEKKELKELVAKKKAKTLNETEAARLTELNKKCGFKGDRGKRGSKSEKKGFTPGNDFSWWNKLPELTRDAANFKCNYIAGDTIAGRDLPFVIPGVFLVKLICAFGCDSKATDPINVWARDLYLKMFHNYRPASGYSASDLGIAIIAGVEAVKVIAKYERIYGIVNRYSKLNINMPKVEAAALGLSSTTLDTLQGKLSDFRYDLNYLLRKAQRLCVLKDMSIVADAISLFGYEYADHDTPRSQLILFDSDEYGVYSDTTLSSGGSIHFKGYTGGSLFNFEADNMCTVLVEVLDALLGSDSIQRIYADLVVWFGQEAMLNFVPIPEDYVVAPVYSESMLHKLHNLEIAPDGTHHTSWATDLLSQNDKDTVLNGDYYVYQANDVIVTETVFSPNGTNNVISYNHGSILVGLQNTPYCITECHVIDTYRNDPDAEVVVEGVMYKYDGKIVKDETNGGAVVIDTAAFYIASTVTLLTNNQTPGSNPNEEDLRPIEWDDPDVAASIAGKLAVIDWAPIVYNIVEVDQDKNTFYIASMYGDFDQVIPIYFNDMARLQRTIILSGLHTDIPVKSR